MDDRVREELSQQYKKWILAQTDSRYSLKEVHGSGETPDSIRIETKDGCAEVSFYPKGIVQLSVLSYHIDRHIFFLHFQIYSLEHTQAMYQEMINALLGLKRKRRFKILLCCTSGLTAGYFAEKLNETASLLRLSYEFHAISHQLLYRIAEQYDVVLLAPQIAYAYEKAKLMLPHQYVTVISPKVFASYDVITILYLIRWYLHEDDDLKPMPERDKIAV